MEIEELQQNFLKLQEDYKKLEGDFTEIKSQNEKLVDTNKKLQDYNNNLFMKLSSSPETSNDAEEDEEQLKTKEFNEIHKLINTYRGGK